MQALTDNESTCRVSPIEYYAREVHARTSEIDNAFKGIDIALEYLQRKDYPDSKHQFSSHHVFHAENFLFRLTTVVDRSFLLAGSSMLMQGKKIEKTGGKREILEKALEVSTPSAEILKRMQEAISALNKARNQVAHQAGFSSKNLSVLVAIELAEMESSSIEEITDILPYVDVQDFVIAESYDLFSATTLTLNGLVKDLIDSFAFIYSGLLKSYGYAK